MFRYIALVWNVSDEQQSRTADSLDGRLRARQWTPVFVAKGLRTFCVDLGAGTLRAQPLANDAGVILGTLFERNRDVDDDSPARRATLTARSCEAILASQGRWLIDNCWGNYVALIRDTSAGTVRVLKDPTGTLPCFVTRPENVAVCFSHIGDCVDLGLRRFTIDREYLRARVLGFNDLRRSSLEGVEQVPRGDCDASYSPLLHAGAVGGSCEPAASPFGRAGLVDRRGLPRPPFHAAADRVLHVLQS